LSTITTSADTARTCRKSGTGDGAHGRRWKAAL